MNVQFQLEKTRLGADMIACYHTLQYVELHYMTVFNKSKLLIYKVSNKQSYAILFSLSPMWHYLPAQ